MEQEKLSTGGISPVFFYSVFEIEQKTRFYHKKVPQYGIEFQIVKCVQKIVENSEKSCCLLVNVWYYKYVRFGKTCILVTEIERSSFYLNKSYSILY